MADKPLSHTLEPEVLRATLANLKATRESVDFRRQLKREAGQSSDAEAAQLSELDAQIAAVAKQLGDR